MTEKEACAPSMTPHSERSVESSGSSVRAQNRIWSVAANPVAASIASLNSPTVDLHVSPNESGTTTCFPLLSVATVIVALIVCFDLCVHNPEIMWTKSRVFGEKFLYHNKRMGTPLTARTSRKSDLYVADARASAW
jgi:hypothetical protein